VSSVQLAQVWLALQICPAVVVQSVPLWQVPVTQAPDTQMNPVPYAVTQAGSLVPQVTQVELALQIPPLLQSAFEPQLPCTQVPVAVWQT
jgi:hypothetical protein